MLARLLGLLLPPGTLSIADGGLCGTPNERRETDCLPLPSTMDDVVLPLTRLRLLRTVTVAGMWCPSAEPFRGDARGGVLTGAGSFDLAE